MIYVEYFFYKLLHGFYTINNKVLLKVEKEVR